MIDVWELVKADMEARRVKGLAEYGVAVVPGRTLQDLLYWMQHEYEEALDKIVYLRSQMETLKRMAQCPTSGSESAANTPAPSAENPTGASSPGTGK